MTTRTPASTDVAIAQKLDAILNAIENVLIFEAAKAGVTRDGIREIVRVDSNRISRVMKNVPRSKRGLLSGRD
jgi:hypothetical protein